MNSFDKPLTYNPQTGTWSLELHKAPKLFSAQCGLKITYNPGSPTGNTGEFYNTKKKSGLEGAKLEVRFFDNLAGWASIVEFDFPTLIEKLIKMMPKDKVHCETFCLAERDRKEVGEV
jgi:hypothetical protein